MKIKCPICEQIYGREEWMIEEEKYPSLLGLAEWHVFYCEWCGAKLEVKLARETENESPKEKRKIKKIAKMIADDIKETMKKSDEVIQFRIISGDKLRKVNYEEFLDWLESKKEKGGERRCMKKRG